MNKVLLYLGDVLIGDVNSYAKNRHLSESLKSEETVAVSDEFTFDINWKLFRDYVATRFDDDPATLLRVGKTRVVFVVDGDRVRFSGFLASRPARIGYGAEQVLSLKFFEHFARLSGDLVCDPADKLSPMRTFTERAGHLYVQDIIEEFIDNATDAGEALNWSYGIVDTLPSKTITYKDFQTRSKALCDAMNNTTGTGKFDVVFRTDPADYTHQIIDILKPRGSRKQIIIKYPSDGVYSLWSTDYETEETNEYASEVLVSGNGQVGDPDAGEDTAELAAASNPDFVEEYCYWRVYETRSNLFSAEAVQGEANKLLVQRDFSQMVPLIKLVGRPIEWGNASNDNNGLAVGDEFFFEESNDDGANQSGWMRIIALDTDWDDNGVETVRPRLIRVNA